MPIKRKQAPQSSQAFRRGCRGRFYVFSCNAGKREGEGNLYVKMYRRCKSLGCFAAEGRRREEYLGYILFQTICPKKKKKRRAASAQSCNCARAHSLCTTRRRGQTDLKPDYGRCENLNGCYVVPCRGANLKAFYTQSSAFFPSFGLPFYAFFFLQSRLSTIHFFSPFL